jgi:hypothetical protein
MSKSVIRRSAAALAPVCVLAVAAGLALGGGTAETADVVRPGELWPDTAGAHINAHGGGVLLHEGVYYWFGEYREPAARGVSCYSSRDLVHWKKEGLALPLSDDPASPISRGNVIERPKVIYNRATRKFVMWFHTELRGHGYDAAQTSVAVSDTAIGPYKFLRSLRPDAGTWPLNLPLEQRKGTIPTGALPQGSKEWMAAALDGGIVRRDFQGGQMARDMVLFVDDDGAAYHIHASEENATLHISRLTDDYLGFSGRWVRAFPGGHNEGPAVFKFRGKYYMITSGCTGWAPNAARSGVADSMLGEWRALGNPVRGTAEQAATTFESQSTFVLPVAGKPGAFIFMADRWRPRNQADSRYVWLPVEWEAGNPVLKWRDEWPLEFFE